METALSEREERVRQWLAGRVGPGRLEHSLGVLAEATRLASRHGEEAAPLRLAALLHDSARELPGAAAVALAEEWGIRVRDVDRESPVLLHGRLAEELARRELGIDDPRVASAVRYHTAGHPEMSRGDMIFFLADMVEPGRRFPWVERLRRAAAADVEGAMRLALEINRRRLEARGKVMDPDSLALAAVLARGDADGRADWEDGGESR